MVGNKSFYYIANQSLSRYKNFSFYFNTSITEEDIISYEAYELPKPFVITIICLYGVMIFISIGGNIVVCHTVFTVQRLRTVTNFFLSSLSISDILMTVVCIPFTVLSNIIYHYWPFWSWMCPLVQYLQLVAVLQRSFIMVAIACDRHFVISKPLKKRISKARARVFIFFFWFLALVIAAPTAVHSEIVYLQFEPGSKGLCIEMWTSHDSRYIYSLVIMILQYFGPLFIMMCTYSHIGYMIWIKKPPGEADCTRDMRIASSKRKTLKMLVAVVMTYAITWLPLHALTIVGDMNPAIYNYMYAHILWLIFHFLAFANSGTNPIIYFYMNKTFRSGFRQLYNKLFCVKNRVSSLRRKSLSQSTTPPAKVLFTSSYIWRRSNKSTKSNESCLFKTELKSL